MIFKQWLSDINKVSVSLDSLNNIRFDSNNIIITETYTNAIRGLNEEQARYVLTKRNVNEIDQNNLLIKAGIISANEGIEATELSRQLVLQGLNKEIAEALIEQEAGNNAVKSNIVLTKEQTASILKQAEARKLLSVEQSKNIADDIKETTTSLEEATAETTQATAKLGSMSSMLSRGVSKLGKSFMSFLSIFVSSPASVIATITGSIIGLTYVIGKLQDTAKNAADKASEFSSLMSSINSTYNSEAQSLEELTEKYKDLRQQLVAAKGNEEETYSIKSQLLELQKQLNEIYGDEYDKVNLVTNAYKDQTSVLEGNARQKAQNYLNKHVDEIEAATQKMTKEYTYELGSFSYGLADANIGNELYSQIKQLAEKSGIKWVKRKGFVFKGTAEEASNAINEFMKNVRELENSRNDLPDYFFDSFQVFFSDMSKQLNYADSILDGYKETYETTQIAQIASDTELSKGYNDAVSAVEDYNEAILKSEDPYNDENVKKAWDNIQTIKQGIQENEDEWGRYSNIMNNVFAEANDDIYSFYNTMQNDNSLLKMADDLRGLSETDLQAMADDDIDDSFDRLYKKAKEYELEIQDVINLLVELGYVQGEVQSSTSNFKNPISLSITKTIDQLNTQLKPAFDSLSAAWSNIFMLDDNNKEIFSLDSVNTDMLYSIQDAISKLNGVEGVSIDLSSYENLAKVLGNLGSNADDVKNSFNELASSIIDGVNVTKGFNDQTKNLCAQLLKEMGIANADQIVLEKLNQSKIQQKAASIDFSDATADEIRSLTAYGEKLGFASQQVYGLYLQQLLVNNDPLQTKSSILQLIGLCQAGSETADTLVDLYDIMDAISKGQQKLANGELTAAQAEVTKSEIEKLKKKMSDKVNNMISSNTEIDWSGTNNLKSPSSSSSDKDLWLEEYKRKLKELENMRDKGIINEREFFDQSEMLLNIYLKDSQAHIKKYEEEISDAENQLHDDWNAAYDSDAENLKKWQEKKLINMADYYRSMMNLQDEYYNSEALKLKNLADEMDAEYGRMGNVNLKNRPQVDAAVMQSAGWTEFDGDYGTVYSQTYSFDNGKQIVVTPILPDGTVLSPEQLDSYVRQMMSGEDIDVNIKLGMFEGENSIEQAEKFAVGLHDMQEEYYALKQTFSENPYGDFTEDQLKAVEELTKTLEEHKNQLSGELGGIKSAYDDLIEIRDSYNEHGKISVDQYQSLCDMGFEYLALLSDESGALSLDEDAFQRLTDAKIQQMQVDMALQAADLIKNIQTEEQAVRYLADAYDNAAASALGMAENILYAAKTNAELMYGTDSAQSQAAANIVKGYENSKLLAGNIGFKMQSGEGNKEDKEEKNFLKTFDWIGTLLKKLSDKTSKLIDKVDKFYNWQKKNSMINRAVKAADKEINQNELAYRLYMKKADSVGLGLNYVRKVQDGTLSFEDITDEMLSDKIDKYQEWYDKAQDCLDTIEDLYDRQRDLIRQKLNNVLDYYSDMDSYLSSVTSKIESIISLNDEMGKRSSLTELVEQFAAVSDRLENNTTAKNTAAAGMTDDTAVSEVSFGDSKKVAEAREHDRKELTVSIQSKIDALDVKKTGAYERLADNIAKTQAQIDNYRDRGWDKSKAKSYEKLQKKLQDYHDLQKALDENATSDTIANYEKIYTKYQKLQNKLDSGKSLSKSEQKHYDSYAEQLDGLKVQGQSKLDRLRSELAEADGTAAKQSEADRIKGKIDSVQSDLENTATYQSLKRKIETTQISIAEFDKAGYDNLTNKQKKAYAKMQKQLEDYYAQKKSLDEGATASNIAEYNKTYLAWKKLQDKIDNKKTLSTDERKKYNEYRELLDGYSSEKSDMVSELNNALAEASDPSDKLGQIKKTYEEASKDLYDSYQNQIDSINSGAEGTAHYQNLLAKAQNLEAKKADKKKNFTASDQAKLDEYNAELEALRAGATGSNIGNYMKTWKAWYKLELKRQKNGSLKGSDITNYDKYTALLKAWNEEKQTQISDLHSLMEDDLEQLKKTYDENMAEAESEVNDYYANLYSLAKQIAEYNISSLQTQLDYLDSYISYYKELVSLYDSFSGEKLTKILTDLDENTLAKKTDVYEKYLNTLQDKYNTTLAEMNEYRQLLGALDSNDFESSMELFNKAMENYKSEGNDAMADKLQSVLNLLNERAADADNWDEYADQWANEWEEALSSAKQELIGTASEIQDINDALREIRFENITDAIEELDRAAGILSSIEGLIQDGWLFDDGQMTEYGRAKTALLVSQLEDAQAKADAYLDLYNEIQNNKDTYASDKAYQADLNDALQNYYDALGSAASFENSIMDLMKQNAEEEINSLKDVIEARKKALQSKKEYYDYDKSIRNSQKEIDSLKAQIDALENLSGATDAATKAKLAQLRAELAQKEESLQETKDEHTFNLQIDALDEFADSLTNALDNSSKSVEEILKEQKETVESAKELYQTSAESISVILQKLEAFYKGKGALSDEALLGLVGENVFQYAQANTPQIAFHAETAIPDIIRERNAAPPINVHYDSLIHVEGNIDKEVADLLPEQLEQSYQYVVQQIYSDIRSVSSVKPAARSVI